MGFLHQLIVSTLPLIPRPIMRRLSARYIAGETLAEALTRLEQARARGFGGVLDILGEDVTSEAEARAALASYKAGASALAERDLDAYVSVKPTHVGLKISRELARELYSDLLAHCAGLGQIVRVEMEDHTLTDETLQLYAGLLQSFENVGIVLQARLYRTLRDIAELGSGTHDVRMVKGIYLEPSSIAHTSQEDIRGAFVACTNELFRRGHKVALATHDESLGARLLHEISEARIASERFSFEVLMGVQEHLWEHWRDAGHRVLVYVPYGPEWRSYSQRRLRKNPEVLRHLLRNAFLPQPAPRAAREAAENPS